MVTNEGRVLVLGATGFIGSRLVPLLLEKGYKLRLLVRDAGKVPAAISNDPGVDIIEGDLLSGKGLRDALEGIFCTFYLVHSMGGRSIFRNSEYAEKDKHAASFFIKAADAQGLGRVIYLGALGEKGDDLSEHLKSRAEVADILSSGKASATILRAAIIIGAGGASFEMLRYLVERLPVMGCPRWIDTKIQPVALKDVMLYLIGCLENEATSGNTYDVCGPDIMSYREMMQRYAEARGLAKRLIFRVPLLTPLLSAYWVDLVTPVPSGVAHPLIEGLRNDVICRNNSIRDIIQIELTAFEDAVRSAFSEETKGPGIAGW